MILDLALDGPRDCRYGPRSNLGRRDTLEIEGDLLATLPDVSGTDLQPSRLTPAIAAHVGALQPPCVASTAESRLGILLSAHARGELVWSAANYSRSEDDHHLLAEALLDATQLGASHLGDYLDSILEDAEATSVLLSALQYAATYDERARESLRRCWPDVMQTVLARAEAAESPWPDAPRYANPLPRVIPSPQLSMIDRSPDATLRSATDGWPSVEDLRTGIERWTSLVPGNPEAIDALVSFLRTCPAVVQGGEGLSWVLGLSEDHTPVLARNTRHLVSWFEELRARDLVQEGLRVPFIRLIDGLAENGDRAAVLLQREDERHS
ncbi:hypothetical protein HQ535_11985 [bacterium]|nr:hypothetical protein [bacterium]